MHIWKKGANELQRQEKRLSGNNRRRRRFSRAASRWPSWLTLSGASAPKRGFVLGVCCNSHPDRENSQQALLRGYFSRLCNPSRRLDTDYQAFPSERRHADTIKTSDDWKHARPGVAPFALLQQPIIRLLHASGFGPAGQQGRRPAGGHLRQRNGSFYVLKRKKSGILVKCEG